MRAWPSSNWYERWRPGVHGVRLVYALGACLEFGLGSPSRACTRQRRPSEGGKWLAGIAVLIQGVSGRQGTVNSPSRISTAHHPVVRVRVDATRRRHADLRRPRSPSPLQSPSFTSVSGMTAGTGRAAGVSGPIPGTRRAGAARTTPGAREAHVLVVVVPASWRRCDAGPRPTRSRPGPARGKDVGRRRGAKPATRRVAAPAPALRWWLSHGGGPPDACAARLGRIAGAFGGGVAGAGPPAPRFPEAPARGPAGAAALVGRAWPRARGHGPCLRRRGRGALLVGRGARARGSARRPLQARVDRRLVHGRRGAVVVLEGRRRRRLAGGAAGGGRRPPLQRRDDDGPRRLTRCAQTGHVQITRK